MNNTTPSLTSMTGRLDAIRARYRERGLKLGLPASVETLEVFEQLYRIRVPEEYRRFLLEVDVENPVLHGVD